jgi:Spy/CpxP family protein refolding chaperone
MKSMALTVILLCTGGVADAQRATQPFSAGGTPVSGLQGSPSDVPASSTQSIDRLATLLDLDEGQKAQVKAILDQERAKMQEVVQEAKVSGENPSIEQMQTTLAQLQKEAHEQLSAILTGAQLKKFEMLSQHGLSSGPSAGLMLQAPSADCSGSGPCDNR